MLAEVNCRLSTVDCCHAQSRGYLCFPRRRHYHCARRVRQRSAELGPVARAGHDRRVAHREAANRMERDEERQVEGRDSRPGIVVPGRLERSHLPAHRDSRRRVRRRAACSLAAVCRTRGVHQYKVLAIDRKTGKTIWEQVAREEEPHEAAHQDNGTWASSSAITDGTHVFAYFESRGLYAYDMNGKLDLAGRLRRQENAQPVWRRVDAGPPRQHAGRRLGSSQSAVVRDCARQEHRQGTVARRSPRNGHLGHAARRRARRPAAGHRQRDESGAEFRSADRQAGVGRSGHDDERDSVAGVRQRHGLRHERLPRQQPQGDQACRGEGRHQHDRRDRMAARSRHSVCAVTTSLRQHSLFPEDQQRIAVGVRRRERQAALPGAAHCEGAGRSVQRHRSAPMAASTSPAATASPR